MSAATSDWQYDAERERRINELRKRNGAVCMPDLDYIRGALAAAREALERAKQELKDLRDDTRAAEVERSRNADRFSREGY